MVNFPIFFKNYSLCSIMGKYLLTKNDTSGIIGVIATITQIDHLHSFLVPHRGCHFFRQVHHLSLSQVSFEPVLPTISILRKILKVDIFLHFTVWRFLKDISVTQILHEINSGRF